MKPTSIEWTDYSSNPIRAGDAATGKRGWACTRVSAGCDHCYAEVLNRRWGTGRAFDKAGNAGIAWHLDERELRAIVRSKATGIRVFVADMTDLFHVRVEEAWLDRLFAVFALRPDLTFQILTKRPGIAAQYLNDPNTPSNASFHLTAFWEALGRRDLSYGLSNLARWPLRNVWIGTSVEDLAAAHRIDALRQCKAAVRFLSCEPLLGPLPDLDLSGIHWVIAGGESNGPAERRLVTREGERAAAAAWVPKPEALGWVRDLRSQCQESGVAFFFKQWGGPLPKSGGRVLDGRIWDDYPATGVEVASWTRG